jgi:acylphosphatase
VANEPDGSVTGEVRGQPSGVERFLAELERGPAASAVTGVVREAMEIRTTEAALTIFEIRR